MSARPDTAFRVKGGRPGWDLALVRREVLSTTRKIVAPRESTDKLSIYKIDIVDRKQEGGNKPTPDWKQECGNNQPSGQSESDPGQSD